MGAIQKHWGSVKALPQCFEKWNMKLKMKHKSRMFHFSKWLIFNYFITKNETWKINQKFWKCMDLMWDKLQFKSCESLTEFCILLMALSIVFLLHLSYSFFVIYGNTQSLFYAINSASNSKSEFWVFMAHPTNPVGRTHGC